MQADFSTWQAEVLKALGHPTRIRILEQLKDGERCVCEIIEELRLEQSNVSQHLAVLRRIGLLKTRKSGMMVIYRVQYPQVYDILAKINLIAQQQAEAQISLLKQVK